MTIDELKNAGHTLDAIIGAIEDLHVELVDELGSGPSNPLTTAITNCRSIQTQLDQRIGKLVRTTQQ